MLRITDRWRWILVPCASIVAFYIALSINILLLFSPFPRPLLEPVAGFIMPLLIILTGSLVAPSHRAAVSAFLCVGALTATLRFHLHPVGACTGAAAAVAFVAWWLHPRRANQMTRRVAIGAAVLFVAFIVLVYAYHSGRLDRSDALPPALSHVLGTNAARITAFYLHDLGGFLDSQSLWRIDARPDVVELVIKGLNLQVTQRVPPRFWRMPPHYWLRSMSTNAEAFQSRFFAGEPRGPDGSHYFLLHDRTQERAFVWVKDNF